MQHAPDEPVQKREALRVAVADELSMQGRDGAAGGGAALRSRVPGSRRRRAPGVDGSEEARGARRRPRRPRPAERRSATSARTAWRKPSRSAPSARCDRAHQNRLSCFGGAARRWRRSARSVEPDRAVVRRDQERARALEARGERGRRRRGATGNAGAPRRCARRRGCRGPARAAASRARRVLTSTGKRSRCLSAQASFGSMSSGSMPPSVACRDLVDGEAVEAHQPVGLVEPVLAQQRRRLARQGPAGVGDRAEAPNSRRAAVVVAIERARSCAAPSRRSPRRRRRSSASTGRRARSAGASARRFVDALAHPAHGASDRAGILLRREAPQARSVGSSMLIDSRSAYRPACSISHGLASGMVLRWM